MRIRKQWRDGKLILFEIDGVSQPIIGNEAPPPTAPRVIKPVWPVALKPLKVLAKPGDRGAGDIIARKVGPIGGDAFKKWWKLLFGRDCGCAGRQDKLNALYPL
jgi:hypothetical protein